MKTLLLLSSLALSSSLMAGEMEETREKYLAYMGYLKVPINTEYDSKKEIEGLFTHEQYQNPVDALIGCIYSTPYSAYRKQAFVADVNRCMKGQGWIKR
ncbi:MAG: hypothetical protein ACPGMR_08155 [Pontibacterium sp.]